MDHDKYHALRDAAVSAYNEGNAAALAAIVESGDMLYTSTDWSTWSDEERVAFGIMTGLKIAHPEGKGRAFLVSREAGLCALLLGHSDQATIKEIAKLVWSDIK